MDIHITTLLEKKYIKNTFSYLEHTVHHRRVNILWKIQNGPELSIET